MKMYVVGVSKRLQGESKKGYDYDFFNVECLCHRFENEGCKLAISSLIIDSALWLDFRASNTVSFPFTVSVEFNQRGRVVDLALVKGSNAESEIAELVSKK